MPGVWTTKQIKDGNGTLTLMRLWDESGVGTGPFSFGQTLTNGDGTTAPPAFAAVPTTAQTMSAGFQLVDTPTDGTNATRLGGLTETAPATDTASSGANGRLQRIAQRITSLIATILPSATANGLTKSRVNAAASTNATNLKASAGQIYHIDLFNVAAYTVFLKLYNKASAPTVGTDTPVMTIPIQAGGGYSKSYPAGSSFATGISYAITKLQADSDTTVVVAGDVTGEIEWI